MKHTSNKLIAFVLSSNILLSCYTTAFAVQTKPANTTTSTEKAVNEITASVTGDDVYLRAAATSLSNIITTLSKNSKVIVLNTTNKDWTKVQFNGTIGYMSSKYLETIESVDEKDQDNKKDDEIVTGTVTGSDVRMRSNPSTNGSIVKTLNRFDQVTVLDTSVNGWYKVQSNDLTGFVSQVYINLSTEDTTSTTAATTESLPKSDTSVKAIGIINASAVRVRSSASTDGTILTSLNKNSVVAVIGVTNDWYKVAYDGKEGYVFSKYLDISASSKDLKSYGKVTASALNVRSKASSNGTKICELSKNVYVDVTGFENGWFYITYNNNEGYVSGDYLNLCFSKATSTTTQQNPVTTSVASVNSSPIVISGSGTGSEIASLALQYLGTPYVYGGASPSGFDCSGFTMYVYKQFGYSLPHGATPQLNYGVSVSKSELQVGDLVFFRDSSISSSSASHCGIYIGNNEFVHASSSSGNSRSVCISSLDSSYYSSHYLCARHVAN